MLSHDDIEIFTGREQGILAGKCEKYLSQLFSVQNKGERKQRRKSGGVRGGWQKGNRKVRRGIQIKKLMGAGGEREARGRVRGGQRAEFTIRSCAAPYLPAGSQIHWHLPYMTETCSIPPQKQRITNGACQQHAQNVRLPDGTTGANWMERICQLFNLFYIHVIIDNYMSWFHSLSLPQPVIPVIHDRQLHNAAVNDFIMLHGKCSLDTCVRGDSLWHLGLTFATWAKPVSKTKVLLVRFPSRKGRCWTMEHTGEGRKR